MTRLFIPSDFQLRESGNASGNLGIGTTSPRGTSMLLDVYQARRFSAIQNSTSGTITNSFDLEDGIALQFDRASLLI